MKKYRIEVHTPTKVFYGRLFSEEDLPHVKSRILNNLNSLDYVTITLEDESELWLSEDMIGRCAFNLISVSDEKVS
jgi:hypothetical protein